MKNIISNLQELEQESITRGIPILGSEKGAWLYQKVREVKPKKILELGTANGYSGCILGSNGAELTTVEIDGQIAQEATINFGKHSVNAWIIIGDGVKVVHNLVRKNKEKYDMIFIDFAKKQYNRVLEDCITLVNKRGVIIADNIAMDGCQDYKKAVLKHPQLKTEIITIKDGLSCSVRVK